MKKVSKIIIAIVIILTFIIVPQTAFAKVSIPITESSVDSGDAKIDYEDIGTWNFRVNEVIPDSVMNIVGLIIKFLRNISIVITVLVITILGIKYMIGSLEQKAEYKKAYTNIIIGVALVTLVTSIIDVIFSAAQNII